MLATSMVYLANAVFISSGILSLFNMFQDNYAAMGMSVVPMAVAGLISFVILEIKEANQHV